MTNTLTTVAKPRSSASQVGPAVNVGAAEKKKTYDLFERLQEYISPPAFFGGLLLGFVLCCLGGYATTKVNQFKDFLRFYPGISLETSFYPTVSELLAIARAKVSNDQTLVIIGGNSILNGVGQRAESLWSRRLQQELGPKFCVLNYAFRGSMPFEAGYFAFEKMSQEHPKILYVTVAAPSICGNSEGGATYGYMYWQARDNNYLLPDQAREKAVAQRVAQLQGPKADKLQELKIRSQLDSVCHFNDLWNAVSVNLVSTVWHQFEKRPFKPRRKTSDEERLAPPVHQRFVGQEKDEMPIVRGVSSLLFKKNESNQWQPVKAFWDAFDQQASGVIPQQLRKQVLVVFSPNCPYFERQLTQDERERNKLAYSYGRKKWEELGFHCMVANGRTDADYIDRVHLVPSGGNKLAIQLAPQIKSIAQSRGWINE